MKLAGFRPDKLSHLLDLVLIRNHRLSIWTIGFLNLDLDRGRPVDDRVAPLVAHPTLILDVLPCRIHLPLATGRYFVLVTEPSLELHDLPLITIRLETLPASCSLNNLLLVKDLRQEDSFISSVLLGCLGVQDLEHVLALSLQVPVLMWATMNPLLKVISSGLGGARIPREVNSNQTLCSSQRRTEGSYHHLIKPGVAQVEMDEMLVVLYESAQVVQKGLRVII